MDTITKTFAEQGIQLNDYQFDGCKWMLSKETKVIEETHPRGGLLCDEMGLGKTIQTIGLIIGNVVPNTLIITPASLVSQWESEFKKFSPKTRVVIFKKNNIQFKASIVNPIIVIVSYNTFLRNFKNINISDLWDRVVCDEVHYIRNHRTKLFKTIYMIKAKYRWGLTGTPIQNKVKDLYNILQFIGFDLKYIKKNIKDIIPNYILKRTKNSVNIEMKSIKINTCEIELTKNEGEAYKSINKNMVKSTIIERMLRERQCSIGCSIIPNKFINQLWDDKEHTRLDKVIECSIKNKNSIIFCSFINEMDYIYNKLIDITPNVDIISGKKSNIAKQKVLQNLDNLDYLIIQINCGGTGLNLQRFNNAIITSPNFNPMLEEQAIARIYRIGQTKDVNIYKFIGKDTIDNYITKKQNEKNTIISELFI